MVQKFATIDLHPEVVANDEMGYVFEELIRRFSEQSNETAGEHFTPREVVRLMVDLLFIEDDALLRERPSSAPCTTRPAAPAGCSRWPRTTSGEFNPDATLKVFGQELNPESYAICRSDMMIKGQDATNIALRQLLHPGRPSPSEKFDYFLSNPPFGVEWKKVETDIRDEHEKLGMDGRFGAGLPRINDGSLLFLQHMISKFKARRRWLAARHRVQRLAAVHGRGRIGRERDPPLDHRERLAGSHRRACPTSCSTTRASRPTSGSSPTASQQSARARSS